ncbi:MAG TPA: helix-turn-helix domain-containing protein [Solirubrobacteraceae bacterium]|nr:helix-turn-helix domain-containing protein [Solirubrobacteraceae bacterium]
MTADLPQREGRGGRGARGRILQAARVLFRNPGINATGVAELAAAAQVSKRTLYRHFPSKDHVILAYLQDFEDHPELGAEAVLAREDLAPRARLLELFAALEDEPAPARGCPFVNAAVELADSAHPAHRLAVAHKRRFADRLGELARAAGARGADDVGRRLALLYDGASAQAAVHGSAQAAGEARAIAAAILRDAIDPHS